MQTRTLRTLIRIAQLGSFSQSAEQLNMTLSAVSMQMKSLEAELGVSLFDRGFRPPRLTPIGRAVADKAEALLQAEAELTDLCSPDEVMAGRFRIGFVPTASVRLLPGFLRRATAQLPRAQFDFETGLSEVLEGRLRAGQLDGAVLTAAGPLGVDLHSRLICTEPLIFGVHWSLQRDGRKRMLRHAPFLHFTPGSGIGKLIAEGLSNLSRHASASVIVLDSVEAIMECVQQGLGFTLLPAPDIARYADGDIDTFDLPDIRLNRQLVLATRDADPIGRFAATLVELLSDA